jgi:hypothetical protein
MGSGGIPSRILNMGTLGGGGEWSALLFGRFVSGDIILPAAYGSVVDSACNRNEHQDLPRTQSAAVAKTKNLTATSEPKVEKMWDRDM